MFAVSQYGHPGTNTTTARLRGTLEIDHKRVRVEIIRLGRFRGGEPFGNRCRASVPGTRARAGRGPRRHRARTEISHGVATRVPPPGRRLFPGANDLRSAGSRSAVPAGARAHRRPGGAPLGRRRRPLRARSAATPARRRPRPLAPPRPRPAGRRPVVASVRRVRRRTTADDRRSARHVRPSVRRLRRPRITAAAAVPCRYGPFPRPRFRLTHEVSAPHSPERRVVTTGAPVYPNRLRRFARRRVVVRVPVHAKGPAVRKVSEREFSPRPLAGCFGETILAFRNR